MMTVEDYIREHDIEGTIHLKYVNTPFQVWEVSNGFILVWDDEVIRFIPKF